jgi:hypothetical protein
VRNRTRGQRRLLAARLALVQPPRAMAYDVEVARLAPRTAKALGTSYLGKRPFALRLRAIVGEKLLQLCARLELEPVHRHPWLLRRVNAGQRKGRLAHDISLAGPHDQSGRAMTSSCSTRNGMGRASAAKVSGRSSLLARLTAAGSTHSEGVLSTLVGWALASAIAPPNFVLSIVWHDTRSGAIG